MKYTQKDEENIIQNLLPTKSETQLANRFKNLNCNTSPMNPLKVK